MAATTHHYTVRLDWTGARGTGTTGYGSYGRDHVISAPGVPPITGSSDPAFLGDAARWNPELLLLASLCACHQLWYLHLCAVSGVVVLAYADNPEGLMCESADGSGSFVSVTLHPEVTIATGDTALAERLHDAAHAHCFIARSMNFPVRHAPVIRRTAPR